MKISLYGPFPPNIGGVSIHVKNLASRLNIEGCLSYVYINNQNKYNNILPAYCIDISYSHMLGFLKDIKLFIHVFFKDKSDILHIHGSLFWDYFIALGCILFTKKKIVFTVHDQMQLSKGQIQLLLYKLMYLFVRNKIIYIAVNQNIKSQLIDILKIREDKIFTIPAFIHVFDNKTPLNDELKNILVGNKFKILSYVPSLNHESNYQVYGIDFLFEVLQKLIDIEKDILLLLCVPTGIDQMILKKYLKKYNVPMSSIYIFNKPVSNMGLLLKNIDVYVRTTITDGDSVLVREALAYKNIVLCSDVVPRPNGVILYKNKSISDFISKIKYIKQYRKLIIDKLDTESDFYNKILKVYDNEK